MGVDVETLNPGDGEYCYLEEGGGGGLSANLELNCISRVKMLGCIQGCSFFLSVGSVANEPPH